MKNNGQYKVGHKHSAETLEKIRLKKLGWRPSPESIAKRVESRKGYKHSEETRKKISESNKGKIKSPESIEKHRLAMLGTIPWNKGTKQSREVLNSKQLDWENKNREKRNMQARRSHLKKTFGMTIEDYEFLLVKQNNKCAICYKVNSPFVDVRGRNRPTLFIDHDHATGLVRGLLCHSCNIGIGYLKDSTDIIENALLYLKDSIDKP